MIQITSLRQFDKAKTRAAAGKLTVTRSTLLRQYRVLNEETGATYRVDFYRAVDGRKYATCESKGAQGGYVCKHMGAALPVHLEIMLALETAEKMKAGRLSRPTPNPAFDDDPLDAMPMHWQ